MYVYFNSYINLFKYYENLTVIIYLKLGVKQGYEFKNYNTTRY